MKYLVTKSKALYINPWTIAALYSIVVAKLLAETLLTVIHYRERKKAPEEDVVLYIKWEKIVKRKKIYDQEDREKEPKNPQKIKAEVKVTSLSQ